MVRSCAIALSVREKKLQAKFCFKLAPPTFYRTEFYRNPFPPAAIVVAILPLSNLRIYQLSWVLKVSLAELKEK